MSLIYNDNFKDLMIYETARAKNYFNSATSNLDLDDKKTMFAARAMQHIYYKMLEKLSQLSMMFIIMILKFQSLKKLVLQLEFGLSII